MRLFASLIPRRRKGELNRKWLRVRHGTSELLSESKRFHSVYKIISGVLVGTGVEHHFGRGLDSSRPSAFGSSSPTDALRRERESGESARERGKEEPDVQSTTTFLDILSSD